MDISEINGCTLAELKETVKLSELPKDEPQIIHDMKIVNSKYGETTLIDLEETRASLDALVSTLAEDEFHILENELHLLHPEVVKLLTRKGVFPYDYITNVEKLDEKQLPSIEQFYNEINAITNNKKHKLKGNIWDLNPFVDPSGELRVGGRLQLSAYAYGKKHPALLSGKHHLTRLIFLDEHTIGVDFAGPFLIETKAGRGNQTSKGYISLFVCFVTKAIHLELVSSATTEALLAAFRRCTAKRGKPLDIYSDNGTNFVVAKNELEELGNFLKHNAINSTERIANEGVNWHFIPAFSPHFGGIWEAGVKSCRTHLKRVIEDISLTFEQFYTVLTEIEAVLNSRPLTPISSDPNDFTALTPSHFLIGRPLTTLPDPDLTTVNKNRLFHFQCLQQLQQHFWTRWSQEYVSELQIRTKWRENHDVRKIGALVLIKDDRAPPLRWKLGRISTLHPGLDGVARVATINTSQGLIKRAFTKICPLPIELPETRVKEITGNSAHPVDLGVLAVTTSLDKLFNEITP
ncbi:uncharacterized protein [Leptinotarsa decemlineata]|uniref:uncharacterized protein n=1 Tax=Leptinotarsa decemlineata TaxID=7539 RepID=UPI003D305874